MKNLKRTGRMILLAAGVLIVFLAVKALTGVPALTRALDEAVYLDEPVVLPENEGRMVVIHGMVEQTKPVYDVEYGLTLDTVKAYRYDEEYRQTGYEADERKWQWQGTGQKGIVGGAKIGEFELDEQTLIAFPTESYYSEFDAEEISRYGTDTGNTGGTKDRTYVLVDAGKYYFEKEYSVHDNRLIRSNTREDADAWEGDRVCYYRYYDASRYDAMTVAGIQQGNRLVTNEEVGAVVISGAAAKDEMVNLQRGAQIGGASVFLLLGLMLIYPALRKNKKGIKENQ